MKIVNDNYHQKLQSSFGASFSFDGSPKVASFAFGAGNVMENSCLERTAGIKIDNGDEHSVKESILRYVTNELSVFPIKLGVSIDLIPVSLDKSRGNAILDAQGNVNIQLKTKVIQLPILVQNGELLPFDVIESEGQRVPFSRENLAKIISGIERWHREQEQGEAGLSSDGFDGVEPPLNAATTPGFMGDVMSIRDQHMQKRGPSNLTTVANEYGLDSLLEKTAGMKELSDKEAQAIADSLNKKAYEEQKAYFDKLAAEDAEFEKIASKQIEKLAEVEELPFRDISECKHEDIILFSEETGEGEFTITKAIVFKEFKKVREEVKPMTIILSTDGRMRVLKPGEKFQCVISPNETFKVSKKDFSTLNREDVFIAIDGADVFVPMAVEAVETLRHIAYDFNGIATSSVTNEKMYSIKELQSSHMIEQYTQADSAQKMRDEDFWETGRINIFNLKDTALTLVNYSDFLDRKSKEMGAELSKTQEMFHKNRACNENYKKGKYFYPLGTNVLCADEHFRVIPITGKIGNSLDIRARQKVSAPLQKVASVQNQIRVECIDRSLKLFNVSLWYKDEEKKMFNARKQDFNRISEGKVKAILRILKFSPQDTNNILYRAKNGRYEERNLPAGVTSFDVKMIEGGQMTNISTQNVKKTVNKLINPKAIATSAATALATDLIIDTIKSRALAPGGKKAVNTIYKGLRFAFASSKETAGEFEKIAMETKSHDMLTVAKALMLSSCYLEKCANVVSEQEMYPEFRKVSKEILDASPLFEKIAYDLVEFNREQFKHKGNMIAPSVLTEAVHSLDTMYKMAKIVNDTPSMEKVLEV